MNELARKKCKPCEGGVKPFAPHEIGPLLKGVPGWKLEGGRIARGRYAESEPGRAPTRRRMERDRMAA